MILLLNTWIFEEPFVAKFPAMGLKRRGALQTRGHLWEGWDDTFQIFISRMTPLLILLNAIPWGRLTWFLASHHWHTDKFRQIAELSATHGLAMTINPSPIGIQGASKGHVGSTSKGDPWARKVLQRAISFRCRGNGGQLVLPLQPQFLTTKVIPGYSKSRKWNLLCIVGISVGYVKFPSTRTSTLVNLGNCIGVKIL